MKILMLTWEYPPRVVGGISRVVYDLSHRLIKDGHEVTVVTYRDGEVPYYEDDKGVKVYRVDNYMIQPNNFIDWILQLNFNMVEKANQIIAEQGKFDVIHAHDWLVANAANEVIVNSNYMKSEVQRLFGLPFEKINVVPNGVNLNKFTGMDRDYSFRRKYAMDNEKIILFMGRLVYEKGVQNLIAAMPKVLSSYHDAKLVIAGKGGMLDELKAQADYLGISNKVYFAGYMNGNDVEKMYKAADISVFPSTYEPFGIVALEGMLAERPIVVSDAGGLGEIVEHRVTGMKSYCGNPNSIADSILELLFNPELCDNIVKNAKIKVKENYNWQKIAQDTHFTYQKAICETMAERQKKQIAQEKARIERKNISTEKETTNILPFKKRQIFA